ncbi:MAG: SIS domain-containing protein [Elusimicrobiota bacterium]|jgi:D-sedoheptulose 7-phosphate isomerase|nr:SIS domain-containing protein [Elusimicrobiota bacterium]
MEKIISSLIDESICAKQSMLNKEQVELIKKISNVIINAYKNGNKTIIAGNGGSASDALHFAAEMVVRFETNRKALPSIALSENQSSITAIGNDFGYENSFSRQLEAFAQRGDIFIAISTSGNSINIINSIETAKKLGIFTVGFTNFDGGKMKFLCDLCYFAPSKITARVQECHILLIHIIAKLVESEIFK